MLINLSLISQNLKDDTTVNIKMHTFGFGGDFFINTWVAIMALGITSIIFVHFINICVNLTGHCSSIKLSDPTRLPMEKLLLPLASAIMPHSKNAFLIKQLPTVKIC